MKLNVTRSEDEKEDGTSGSDEPKQAGARFIMRTAQTHKVILNTPIFKEMQIGDAAGKDPVGKQILFSVPVDGKVIPCTVRVRTSVYHHFLREANTVAPDGQRRRHQSSISSSQGPTRQNVTAVLYERIFSLGVSQTNEGRPLTPSTPLIWLRIKTWHAWPTSTFG